MDSTMNSLYADSISMTFDKRRVLSDVYLKAEEGDIIGIFGRNGSGKSTLYKCLLGQYRTAIGTLHINGKYINKKDARKHIAYLPQECFLPFDLRLEQSATLILGRRGNWAILEADSRAKYLIKKKARQLSVGEIRYVECLIALSLNREVYLLDEPFSQIEPIYCQILNKYIRNASIGKVTLVSDHLYINVQSISTRLKVLVGGTLKDVENSHESLKKYGYLHNQDAL
jgi:ABC-type multidrug transport system ATPase subunit